MLERTNPAPVLQPRRPGVPNRHHEEANPRGGGDHRAYLRNSPAHAGTVAVAVALAVAVAVVVVVVVVVLLLVCGRG
ncbi:hypothetical protein K505DRAFT_135164 [Melanomma pulvis-pyrius CBS 109.77]|uniref:Uncharacterized protein n=1 Tax=Melanomma pulvis-pyrius CBS 109.77 TaxID=1314802 RepID=A0A6A6WS78_9PLEO|nr:hypothetical protein K505DRAFT_135164 [Melanomma pulvis-pyrius CBS 109.77]